MSELEQLKAIKLQFLLPMTRKWVQQRIKELTK